MKTKKRGRTMIHVKRNGPTEPGMYGVTEPESGGSSNVQPMRNDTELRKKLLSAKVDGSTIQQIVDRLLHKHDFAELKRGATGEWTVAFGNKKTG
ncbi:MAG TPA: hypothetical protein VJX30_19885 [Terriglobales bacterium]|nr:hypothetical protein [Terriglobales bacterium]